MRDVVRIVFSAALAVACHLALASLAFGGPPCECQSNGVCVCGPACPCPAPPAGFRGPGGAAAAQPTCHYEQRCVGGRCSTFLVEDAAVAAPAAAPVPYPYCNAGPTCAAGQCGTAVSMGQSAEPPRAGNLFGIGVQVTCGLGDGIRARMHARQAARAARRGR